MARTRMCRPPGPGRWLGHERVCASLWFCAMQSAPRTRGTTRRHTTPRDHTAAQRNAARARARPAPELSRARPRVAAAMGASYSKDPNFQVPLPPNVSDSDAFAVVSDLITRRAALFAYAAVQPSKRYVFDNAEYPILLAHEVVHRPGPVARGEEDTCDGPRGLKHPMELAMGRVQHLPDSAPPGAVGARYRLKMYRGWVETEYGPSHYRLIVTVVESTVRGGALARPCARACERSPAPARMREGARPSVLTSARTRDARSRAAMSAHARHPDREHDFARRLTRAQPPSRFVVRIEWDKDVPHKYKKPGYNTVTYEIGGGMVRGLVEQETFGKEGCCCAAWNFRSFAPGIEANMEARRLRVAFDYVYGPLVRALAPAPPLPAGAPAVPR